MSATTVWKFPVTMQDEITIDMPEGAFPMFVAPQNGTVFLWARVNPSHHLIQRRFRVAGTGHPISDGVGRHIGSFMLHGGTLVFHLFEMPDA